MARVLGAKDGTLLCVFSKAGSVSNLNLKERKLWVLDEDPGETEVQGCFDLTEVTGRSTELVSRV